ncbi:unnamed protein product [Camellia sinensis]
MASKTKIYIVLEYVGEGELFDKIPENLLLDSFGVLKVSDFGLSAFSQQVQEDVLFHTGRGTPNYVAPEVSIMMSWKWMVALMQFFFLFLLVSCICDTSFFLFFPFSIRCSLLKVMMVQQLMYGLVGHSVCSYGWILTF